jgi:hypothetical protein
MSGAGPRIRSPRCSPSTTASATSSRSVRPSVRPSMPKLTHTPKKKKSLLFPPSAALSAGHVAFIRWRSFKALTSSPRFGFQRCPVNEILVHSPSSPAFQSLHPVPYHSCYRYFTGCPCFSLFFFICPTPSRFGRLNCFSFWQPLILFIFPRIQNHTLDNFL